MKRDLTGQSFGDLRVLSRYGTGYRPVLYWCLCACGKRFTTRSQCLILGYTTSCGCKRKIRPYEALYNCFVAQAGRVHAVELTYEDFLVFTKEKFCLYCQAPVTWAEFNPQKHGQNYNLDRMNNSLWYTNENCIVCCTPCNMRRGDKFTHDQFLEIGDLIRRWRRNGTD